MIFYALISAGPEGDVERRGFQPLQRGTVDVNVSEKHV